MGHNFISNASPRPPQKWGEPFLTFYRRIPWGAINSINLTLSQILPASKLSNFDEARSELWENTSKWQSRTCGRVEQLPQMESLLASYSKSNNFYLNLRSDWCIQLRFEFVYPYHAYHKTAAPEPLTIPTTDWNSFHDDKLANCCLLNSFKNAKKSSESCPSFSMTLQQVFRKLLEHFGMVMGHFPKSQS